MLSQQAKVLFIYSSIDGQTEKIVRFMCTKFKNPKDIKMIKLENVFSLNLDSFDMIILGASIRYGKHNKKAHLFIKKNIHLLSQKKTVFFSVNVVARKLNKDTAETNPYVIKFLKQTNWSPTLAGVFAGKVDYPNYSIFEKLVIKFIMFITKGPTDTSQSYEFTNWQKVELFAQKINEL